MDRIIPVGEARIGIEVRFMDGLAELCLVGEEVAKSKITQSDANNELQIVPENGVIESFWRCARKSKNFLTVFAMKQCDNDARTGVQKTPAERCNGV